MPSLKVSHSPGSRILAGNHVLEAAKTVDVSAVKKRLALFATAHKELRAAEEAITKADDALRAQQTKVADADISQDDAVDALAVALVADGASRIQPFKKLGFASPSDLKELGYAREAKEAKRLAKAASKGKTSKGTAAACKKLDGAAQAVKTALASIPKLDEALRGARTRRDAVAQPWETAFVALKNAARAAEDDGARGIFDALFQVDAPRAKKPVKKSAGDTPPPAVAAP